MKHPTSSLPPLPLPWRSWWLLPVSVVLFVFTLSMGVWATRFGSPGVDLNVDVSLIADRNQTLTALALFINALLTPMGNVIILAVVCVVLMFVLRRPLTALAFGSTVAVGWVSSEIGKVAVARLRPPGSLTHALILENGRDSFPSGHTAFAAALVWAAILILARTPSQRAITAVIGGLFALSVASSRLYLGVHYPTDVAGSLLISTAAILFWLPLWNNLIEPRLRQVSRINKMSSQAQRIHTVK